MDGYDPEILLARLLAPSLAPEPAHSIGTTRSFLDDSILLAAARFIADRLVRPIDPDDPASMLALARTADARPATASYWADDAAWAAELFAVPIVRRAYPAAADALLDYLRFLAPETVIGRRSARPVLRLVDDDPRHFHAETNFLIVTGDLTRGLVRPAVRLDGDATRPAGCYGGHRLSYRLRGPWRASVLKLVAPEPQNFRALTAHFILTGNLTQGDVRASMRVSENRIREVVSFGGDMIEFTYRGRPQRVPADAAIRHWAIEVEDDRLVFQHTSVIEARPFWGQRVRAGELTCRYTIWRDRPTITVSMVLKTDPGVTLDHVMLTTTLRQLSVTGRFEALWTGRQARFQSNRATAGRTTIAARGALDYLGLQEATASSDGQVALHVLLPDGGRLHDVAVEMASDAVVARVRARYALGSVGAGTEAAITEERWLTRVGQDNVPDAFRAAVAAIMPETVLGQPAAGSSGTPADLAEIADTMEVTAAINGWSIEQHVDRLVFNHASAIERLDQSGAPVWLGSIAYEYTLWHARPSLSLAVSVTTASGTEMHDIVVGNATGLGAGRPRAATAVIGRNGAYSGVGIPSRTMVLHQGAADYLALIEVAGAEAGVATGLSAALVSGAQLQDIVVEAGAEGGAALVRNRYAIAALGGGETAVLKEEWLVTDGGPHDQHDYYQRVAAAGDIGTGSPITDPSATVAAGAALNAVAVAVLFTRRGLYGTADMAEDRSAALIDWYERHLDHYLGSLRADEPGAAQRVGARSLAFALLSLDCMVRAVDTREYRAALGRATALLQRLEMPVQDGVEESVLSPELDGHAAVLLALARASRWGDPERRIAGAIQRGLRAIRLVTAYADLPGGERHLYDSLALRGHVGGAPGDTGYRTLKLALCLRAFRTIRLVIDRGYLVLDPATDDHMELLIEVARRAVMNAIRLDDGTVEIMATPTALATDAVTEAWAALGLVPAVDRIILDLD